MAAAAIRTSARIEGPRQVPQPVDKRSRPRALLAVELVDGKLPRLCGYSAHGGPALSAR